MQRAKGGLSRCILRSNACKFICDHVLSAGMPPRKPRATGRKKKRGTRVTRVYPATLLAQRPKRRSPAFTGILPKRKTPAFTGITRYSLPAVRRARPQTVRTVYAPHPAMYAPPPYYHPHYFTQPTVHLHAAPPTTAAAAYAPPAARSPTAAAVFPSAYLDGHRFTGSLAKDIVAGRHAALMG